MVARGGGGLSSRVTEAYCADTIPQKTPWKNAIAMIPEDRYSKLKHIKQLTIDLDGKLFGELEIAGPSLIDNNVSRHHVVEMHEHTKKMMLTMHPLLSLKKLEGIRTEDLCKPPVMEKCDLRGVVSPEITPAKYKFFREWSASSEIMEMLTRIIFFDKWTLGRVLEKMSTANELSARKSLTVESIQFNFDIALAAATMIVLTEDDEALDFGINNMRWNGYSKIFSTILCVGIVDEMNWREDVRGMRGGGRGGGEGGFGGLSSSPVFSSKRRSLKINCNIDILTDSFLRHEEESKFKYRKDGQEVHMKARHYLSMRKRLSMKETEMLHTSFRGLITKEEEAYGRRGFSGNVHEIQEPQNAIDPSTYLQGILARQDVESDGEYIQCMVRDKTFIAKLLQLTNKSDRASYEENREWFVPYTPRKLRPAWTGYLTAWNNKTTKERKDDEDLSTGKENADDVEDTRSEINSPLSPIDFKKDMQERQGMGMWFFENLTEDVGRFRKQKFGYLIQSVAEVISSIDASDASGASLFFNTMKRDTDYKSLYCHLLGRLFKILDLFSQDGWYGDALRKLHTVTFDDKTFVVEEPKSGRREPNKNCIFWGHECSPIKENKDFLVLHPTILFVLNELLLTLLYRERARFQGEFKKDAMDEVHVVIQKLVMGIALEIFIGVPVKIGHCLIPGLPETPFVQVPKKHSVNSASVLSAWREAWGENEVKERVQEARKKAAELKAETDRVFENFIGNNPEIPDKRLILHFEENWPSDHYLRPISVEMLQNHLWDMQVGALPKLNALIVEERAAKKDSPDKILAVEDFLKDSCIYLSILKEQNKRLLKGSQFDFDEPTSIFKAPSFRRSLFGSMQNPYIQDYVRNILSLEGVFYFLDSYTIHGTTQHSGEVHEERSGVKRKRDASPKRVIALRSGRHPDMLYPHEKYEQCCLMMLYYLLGKGFFFNEDLTFICYLAIFMASEKFVGEDHYDFFCTKEGNGGEEDKNNLKAQACIFADLVRIRGELKKDRDYPSQYIMPN